MALGACPASLMAWASTASVRVLAGTPSAAPGSRAAQISPLPAGKGPGNHRSDPVPVLEREFVPRPSRGAWFIQRDSSGSAAASNPAGMGMARKVSSHCGVPNSRGSCRVAAMVASEPPSGQRPSQARTGKSNQALEPWRPSTVNSLPLIVARSLSTLPGGTRANAREACVSIVFKCMKP